MRMGPSMAWICPLQPARNARAFHHPSSDGVAVPGSKKNGIRPHREAGSVWAKPLVVTAVVQKGAEAPGSTLPTMWKWLWSM